MSVALMATVSVVVSVHHILYHRVETVHADPFGLDCQYYRKQIQIDLSDGSARVEILG